MNLIAVLQARVAMFLPLEELNPHGRALIPNVTEQMIDRYQFLKFPRTWEEYNPTDGGISYLQGQWKGTAIQSLELFAGGIAANTQASTDITETFLNEVLEWVVRDYQLSFRPEMIKRIAYVSNIIFTSEIELLEGLHPQLRHFEDRISSAVRAAFPQNDPFRVFGIHFSSEPPLGGSPQLSVTIERRAGASFAENKYFSSAPLSTETHLTLLAEFEAAMRGA